MDDLADVIAAQPRLAVVATPPDTHRPVAERLLAAGIAVLCEKPLASSIEDVQALADAADRGTTPLAMATKFRFARGVAAARSAIEAGRLGAIREVEVVFKAAVDMRGRWNSDRAVAGGGW
ncbi:MAG: Gfo/Idh/MocA family oxidoreductase [Ilumatobacteraceae bacterium]